MLPIHGVKNAVFWDVAPCRYCVNRCFGGIYCLHLQGRRRYVPPKRRFTQDLYGATSQKTAFFIVTAVKTSNLLMESLQKYGMNNIDVGNYHI
jgi:hypothetical protein